MKYKTWGKEDLIGDWEFSYKIDGVRCHNTTNGHRSRSDKPLYNIPNFEGSVAEIFCGDFKTTIEKTRTSSKEMLILPEEVYTLVPLDSRLYIGQYTNPTKEFIEDKMAGAIHLGYEGLVLKKDTVRLKVKPKENYDVTITDIFEGKGKYKNKLGGFVTQMGNVGSGFSDKEREELFKTSLIGTIVEVSCMQLTADGKFRHPVFVRLRPDKV